MSNPATGTTLSIAFLGYDASQTRLVGALAALGHSVFHTAQPIDDLGRFDAVVSFGYRHILRPPVIATARRAIVNLHIGLLPFNRGAHPNFWAWVDRTPHGVTIHEIDAGIDTGPILAQRRVDFPDDQISLRSSQARLLETIEALFLDVFPAWAEGALPAVPQSGPGSVHKVRDLPAWVDWDMTAQDVRARYDRGAA